MEIHPIQCWGEMDTMDKFAKNKSEDEENRGSQWVTRKVKQEGGVG